MKKLILTIAIIGAVTTGGGVYALTRESEQPAKPIPVQSVQPTEAIQEETPVIEEPSVVQTQEAQETVEAEETVESVLDGAGWNEELRACVDKIRLAVPEYFVDVDATKKFVSAASRKPPCAPVRSSMAGNMDTLRIRATGYYDNLLSTLQ